MIDNILNTLKVKQIMPYSIITGMLLLLFIYAGFSGWKFFGKPTENWAPDGHGTHNSHGTRHHFRTHK